MTRPVHLIACVAEKRSSAARARDLYQSDWFRKARAYVEVQGGRWFILSALHGAVPPGRIIEPYDLALAAMSPDDRRDWGTRTAAQLAGFIGPRTPIVFLAGRLYRDPLALWAGSRAIIPMQGMGIGQQKAWLTQHARDARDRAAQLDLFDTMP